MTEKYYLTEEKTAKLIAQLNGHKSEVEDVVCINPRNVDGTQTYQQDRIYEATGVMTTLQAVMGGRFYVTDSPQIAGSLEHYGNDQMNRVYSIDGITSTVTALSGGGREQKVAELQQYTDGSGISYAVDANYAKGTSPGDVGNGRRTHVVETVALTERRSDEARAIRQENRRIGRDFSPRRGKVIVPRNDDIANCVTATQTIEQSLLEKPRYRIRKLTPLECWRLQGFSDAAHNTVEAAGVSDSQRYKQAGNAVTVNVIRAIGERLVPLITAITTTKEAA